MRARCPLLATAIASLLVACGSLGAWPMEVPFPENPVSPLSKVSVFNGTSSERNVRMNWPDGFVQVHPVPAGATAFLSGAIGTSGFPDTIDVLSTECDLLATLIGLAPGSAGIVVILDGGAALYPISQGDRSWVVSGSAQACGATPIN